MPVLYRQTLSILAGKKPDVTNAAVKEKYFEIPPNEIAEVSDWEESTGHHFKVDTGTTNFSLCSGSTVAIKEILVIRTDTEGVELNIKLINANGTTVDLPIIPKRTSIFHTRFTDVLVSNTSGTDIEGVFFVAGN